MKNIKLFVFDVGNTLIETNRGLSLSAQVSADLITLKEKGYIVGLSTLRTEEMLKPILTEFEFDFLILMNGGLVKIRNKTVFSCPLDIQLTETIKLQAKAKGINIRFYEAHQQTYAIELFNAKHRFIITDKYQSYIWEYSGNIDITAKGITKLAGLKIVCQEFGISLNSTAAFGDGYNDIDILTSAGFSVAMGNAPAEVRQIADMTTGTAGEDGISTALRKMNIL